MNESEQIMENESAEGLPDRNTPFSIPPFVRYLVVWGALIGAGCVGVSYLIFVIYWTWQHGWVKDIVQQHFPATVGLPLAALCAFLLVTVLQISSGKIEFEMLGLKFRGASGPIVLWVIAFLSIASSIKLLW